LFLYTPSPTPTYSPLASGLVVTYDELLLDFFWVLVFCVFVVYCVGVLLVVVLFVVLLVMFIVVLFVVLFVWLF